LRRHCAGMESESQCCVQGEILCHLRGRVALLEIAYEPEAGLDCELSARVQHAESEFLDDQGRPISEEEAKKKSTGYRQQRIRGGKLYNVSEDTLRVMNARNNYYWATELRVDKIDFWISKDDIAYSTLSDTALYRNTYLSSFFVKPPVVVDAYAGVGMDTISFLHNLMFTEQMAVKKVYSVENEDDDARNERLIHNVHEYIRAREKEGPDVVVLPEDAGLHSQIEFYLNGTEEFFKNCRHFKKDPVDDIDLLYIDPPWTLPGKENKGIEGEATPQELLQFLFETIFQHLIDAKVKVRVACIKTRFEWDKCAPFINMLNRYIQDPSKRYAHVTTLWNKPFKGVYYFHVIKTVEAMYGEWGPSQLYRETYGRNPRVRNDDSEVVAYGRPGKGDDGSFKYRPSQDEMLKRRKARAAGRSEKDAS